MAGSVFPGTGPGQQMPSNDPVLPSALADAYAQSQVVNQTAALQQAAQLSGDSQALLTEALENTLTNLMRQALEDIDATPSGHQRMLRLRDQLSGGSAPTRAGDRRASSEAAPAPADAPPPASPTPGPTPGPGRRPGGPGGRPGDRERYSEGGVGEHSDEDDPRWDYRTPYQEGAEKVQSMGAATRTASRQVGRYLSEHSPYAGYTTDSRTGEYFKQDPDGNEIENSRVDPNSELGRHIRRVGFIGGNLTRFASGEGLTASLGATVARVAGPIGMAVTATEATGHFLEKQNAAAAGYRSDFGQSASFFGASDRIHEAIAGLKGFGTVGGERAREEFRGASALGLRGGQRDQAVDFSREMYTKFGMDTSQAMQIVSQSIEQGNTSLKEFGDAITEVSKSAVKAGRNSSDAIREFMETAGAVDQNVSAGSASTAISTHLMKVADKMPRSVRNALGGAAGLAGVLGNQQAMDAIASQSGMNPMVMEEQLGAGGKTAVKAAGTMLENAQDLVLTQMAANLPGAGTADVLRRDAKQASGGKPLNEEQDEELWLKWNNGSEDIAGQNRRSLVVLMQTYGFQTSETQAVHTFIQFALGTLNADKADSKGYKTGKSGVSQGSVTNPFTGKKTRIDYTKTGGKDTESAVLDSMGYKQRTPSNRHADVTRPVQDKPQDEKAFDAYMKVVKQNKGVGNKAIQALLTTEGQDRIAKDAHVKNAADAKFQVKDRNGKTKTVSLAEAISNPTYRAQLIAGKDASLVTGKHDVEAVGDITGFHSTDTSAPDRNGKKGGSDQRVRIELTGEAKRFLKVSGPSDHQRHGVPATGDLDPSSIRPYGSE